MASNTYAFLVSHNLMTSYLQLVPREAEVIAEDEQVFLMKQQTLLSKAPVANPAARVGIQ